MRVTVWKRVLKGWGPREERVEALERRRERGLVRVLALRMRNSRALLGWFPGVEV